MSTRICKWTRNDEHKSREFIDATRRSHQPLPLLLPSQEMERMKGLANKKTQVDNAEEEEAETREDIALKRRINQLKKQLDEVNLKDKCSCNAAPTEKNHKKQCAISQVTPEERQEILQKTRSLLYAKSDPYQAPADKLRVSHAQVQEVRARQVSDRVQAQREAHVDAQRWGRRLAINHSAFLKETLQEKEEQLRKRTIFKRRLDEQCSEKLLFRDHEKDEITEQCLNRIWVDQLHLANVHNIESQKLEKKDKFRKELLKIIEEKKCLREEKEKEEKGARERDLIYSEEKREFARKERVKFLNRQRGITPN